MTHVVAGFPTKDACLELLLGMQSAGVDRVEVQIPFSDPSADGPTIMQANDVALGNNMTIDEVFKLIKAAKKQGLTVPVYIMSYVNKVYHYGLKRFCERTVKSGVSGFIIPDLVPGSSEHSECAALCLQYGLELIPVLSPGMTIERLNQYNLVDAAIVYVTSTKGITGKSLTIHDDLNGTIDAIRSLSKCKIALGFGIRTIEDVDRALTVADIAVIGSEVIRVVEQKGVESAVELVADLVGKS